MGTDARARLGALQHVVRMPHRLGRVTVLRDLDSWLRLQFLGVMSQSGLGRALADTPRTAADAATRSGCPDDELVESLLQLGVALGELRTRRGRFAIRGRRLRAVASGDADDIAGLVEELIVYDGPIYQHLGDHLAGAPRRDYLGGVGAVIARSSLLAEPIVGPFLATLVEERAPASVLDVGCGTGVNLRWIASRAPRARLTGIDLDAGALAEAERNLEGWSLRGRCRLAVADLTQLPDDLAGPYDLVVLAQNIYYWPPDERADVLARLRGLSSSRVVVISATPGRLPYVRHFDVALRVTMRTWRLPTASELRSDAIRAGFHHVDVHSLAPGSGMVALVAG